MKQNSTFTSLCLIAAGFIACEDGATTGVAADPVHGAAPAEVAPTEPLDPDLIAAHRLRQRDNLTSGLLHLTQRPERARRFSGTFLQSVERAIQEDRLEDLARAPGPLITMSSGESFSLQSDYHRLAELGASQRALKDRVNLLRAYQLSWDLAPPVVRNRHLAPANLNTATVPQLEGALSAVWRDIDLTTVVLSPPGVISPPSAATCQAEFGYGTGSDQNPGTCAAYAPSGLMRNVAFPLRDDLTCVRSQGRRGTCTAFGAVAAIETAVHVRNGNKVNLSEQHAYWYGETSVDYSGRYTYGLNTADFLNELMVSGYEIPREKIWNYNPSRSMKARSGNTYDDSCVGYSETCTDFAFQGEEDFISILGLPVYLHPNPAPNAGAWSVALAVEIGVDAAALDWAKFALDNEVSFAVAVDVTASFRAPDPNGYVTYVANEVVTGGHAMHVAGWVANADLPAGAPAGSGGGYFVLKNSWGENFGDCGYYYVPYNYLLNYGRSLTTVSVN